MDILFTAAEAEDIALGVLVPISGTAGNNIRTRDPNYTNNSGFFDTTREGAQAAGWLNDFPAAASDTTWVHISVFMLASIIGSSADGYWFDIKADDGRTVARFDVQDGQGRAIAFGADGSTAEGPFFTITPTELAKWDFRVVVGSDVEFTIYKDKVEQSQASRINVPDLGTPLTNPTQIAWDHVDIDTSFGVDGIYYSQLIVTDNLSTLGWSVTGGAPSGAGDLSEWAGDPVVLADGDDSTRVTSDGEGQRVSYEVTDYAGANAGNIVAVVQVADGYVSEGGPNTLKHFLRIDGTNYDDPGEAIVGDFTPGITAVWFENPALVAPEANAAWTVAAVNALQGGLVSGAVVQGGGRAA